MANSRDRVFHFLYGECDRLKERGEASHADCIAACLALAAHLLAVASFECGDSEAQYEHRIAAFKEQLEITIRGNFRALRRAMAEPDV